MAVWLAMEAMVVLVSWLLIAAVLRLLAAYLSPRAADAAWSAVVALAAFTMLPLMAMRWARSAGQPQWTPAVMMGAAVIAGLLVPASRRVRAGRVLAICAASAAVLPLAVLAIPAANAADGVVLVFRAEREQPDVVCVIADGLRADVVMGPDGTVRPEFTHLRELQQEATTYTQAFGVASCTDIAVPAMISGIHDVAPRDEAGTMPKRDRHGPSAGNGVGLRRCRALAARPNRLHGRHLRQRRCWRGWVAGVGSPGTRGGRLGRHGEHGAVRVDDQLPAVDGDAAWRLLGDTKPGVGVQDVVGAIARAAAGGRPVFALWHTPVTHGPWVTGVEGRQMYSARDPIAEGSQRVGTDGGVQQTDDLTELTRRLCTSSALAFDRDLGVLTEHLRTAGISTTARCSA